MLLTQCGCLLLISFSSDRMMILIGDLAIRLFSKLGNYVRLLLWAVRNCDYIRTWDVWTRTTGIATWISDFTNFLLCIIWRILILLREQLTKITDRILMNDFFCTTWSATASSFRYSHIIILIFSRRRMIAAAYQSINKQCLFDRRSSFYKANYFLSGLLWVLIQGLLPFITSCELIILFLLLFL